MSAQNLRKKPAAPRPLSTYRGARRNAHLRRGRGVAKRQWPGASARYVPVLIKPERYPNSSARRPGGGRIRRRPPVP